jgi:hypothetical protein
MFALVLMTTSCEKPTNDTPIPIAITANNLVGNWNFYSITLVGGETVDSLNTTRLNELASPNGILTSSGSKTYYATISFLNVNSTTGKLIFYSKYCGGGSTRYSTRNNNPIEFIVSSDGWLKLDANTFAYQISSLNERELVMTPYGKTAPTYKLRKY